MYIALFTWGKVGEAAPWHKQNLLQEVNNILNIMKKQRAAGSACILHSACYLNPLTPHASPQNEQCAMHYIIILAAAFFSFNYSFFVLLVKVQL